MAQPCCGGHDVTATARVEILRDSGDEGRGQVSEGGAQHCGRGQVSKEPSPYTFTVQRNLDAGTSFLLFNFIYSRVETGAGVEGEKAERDTSPAMVADGGRQGSGRDEREDSQVKMGGAQAFLRPSRQEAMSSQQPPSP